jgi:hypothetical protein
LKSQADALFLLLLVPLHAPSCCTRFAARAFLQAICRSETTSLLLYTACWPMGAEVGSWGSQVVDPTAAAAAACALLQAICRSQLLYVSMPAQQQQRRIAPLHSMLACGCHASLRWARGVARGGTPLLLLHWQRSAWCSHLSSRRAIHASLGWVCCHLDALWRCCSLHGVGCEVLLQLLVRCLVGFACSVKWRWQQCRWAIRCQTHTCDTQATGT